VNPLDELGRLTSLFEQREPLFQVAEHIPAAATPEPYRRLLVHDHHMTLAMEEFHGHQVKVHVLDRRWSDDGYHRTSALTVPDHEPSRMIGSASDLFRGERITQFGAIRFNFEFVTNEVRDAIVAEQIPLGKVLIDHNVLRQIDLGAVLRIEVGSGLARLFSCPVGTETYGRLATIFCNRRPAVDLLEVSAPLARSSSNQFVD
jgi:hypothetical protein